MEDRLDRLEKRVEEIAARLDSVVKALALPSAAPPAPAPAASPVAAAPAPAAPAEDWVIGASLEQLVARHRLVWLAGVSSLVLTGAMVLRLLTMSTPIPLTLGAGLGLAYCAALLFVADRRLRAGSLLHGDVFATLAIGILGLLLVEVSHRRDGFGRPVAYAVLIAALALLCAVALGRGRLLPLVVGLLAAPVAGVAIGGRPFLHPWFAGLLAVGLVAGRIAVRRRGWSAVRWGPGLMTLAWLAVYGGLGRAAARAVLPGHAYAAPEWFLPLTSIVFLIVVGPPAVEAVFRARPIDGWEKTMVIGTSVLVLLGSVAVVSAHPEGSALAGGAALLLAALFYAAAAVCYVRIGAESGSFYTIGAVAFAHALVGFPVLLGGTAAMALAWQGLGLALAVFAARLGKRTLSLQAHLLTYGAFAVHLFVSIRLSAPAAGFRIEGPILVACGTLAVLTFERLRSLLPPGGAFSLRQVSIASVASVGLLVAGAFEIVAGMPEVLFPLVRGLPEKVGLEAGTTGAWLTLQTIVLIAAAVGALALGIRRREGEGALLSVALMAGAAVKLVTVDSMVADGPLTIVSAAWFGFSLVFCSLLYRRGRGLDLDPQVPPAPRGESNGKEVANG